ncbi:MAG: hypothetical protein Q4Q24_08805 [Methanobrevibacter ruminantium]|uniref:hypothetical protein n=1 Tax=Methanobrevibacter ruminantium TaxID=83816 RepID=UPI0026F01CF0|nr:hypothetical protein [Methanobrevibacter ruminantium]MCI5737078.1 hypothetical protein [Methanobrevibacter ruminantium]MDD6047996.1 hypothetical protein [Methanobrevibacter ruminantium]MDO5843350.1 hypothetical protein [Methanobrevibacter ruminantium]
MDEDFDEFDDFDDDFEDIDDFEDYDDFEDFDDETLDFDNLDIESKEELDIFDEKPLELDSDYDINAVEVHISTQLTSQKIIQLMDTYPSLKRITCPQSIYNRISPDYIKALDNLGVSIEIKYNWGKKKYSMTQINQVVDLFNEGKRSDEIASELDMPIANVNYIKSKYFDKINVKHYKRKYDDECRQKVKSMRESGLKPKEISKELNIPVRSIYYILNKK